VKHIYEADPKVASALLANAATRVVFRVGDDDAKKLADGFTGFDAASLTSLGVGEAIARIERADHAFNLKTRGISAPDTEAVARRARIIAASRKRYGSVPGKKPEATVTAAPPPTVPTEPRLHARGLKGKRERAAAPAPDLRELLATLRSKDESE
jgi:hypothetical protein